MSSSHMWRLEGESGKAERHYVLEKTERVQKAVQDYGKWKEMQIS